MRQQLVNMLFSALNNSWKYQTPHSPVLSKNIQEMAHRCNVMYIFKNYVYIRLSLSATIFWPPIACVADFAPQRAKT